MRNDPSLHTLQGLLRHSLRNDSPLEPMDALVDRTDQIGRATGAQSSVAFGFADIRSNAVDLCHGGEAEEGD